MHGPRGGGSKGMLRTRLAHEPVAERVLGDETDVTRWWGARTPRPLRRPRPLPAPELQAKVYAQFDEAGPKIGREWPIRYRGTTRNGSSSSAASAYDGSRRCPSAQARDRDVAQRLGARLRGAGARVPLVGTFYPEPGRHLCAELIEAGVGGFKLHTQVGEFRLDDPLLDEAFGRSRTPAPRL